ncbi:carboxymuconolactone decarboxylase family protein [Mucilaginibacter ginsenosidivorax]|nr:carboxymuconolactone decarboxylase family protein [Mucilaginibacter ginsenosidivorax]
MKNIARLTFIPIFTLFMTFTEVDAQVLNGKQRSIVNIAALTAKGDLPALKLSLNTGLDAGLSINEIKEILIQLAAYCGFPRSLNAINTFSAVTAERKAKGISDFLGTEPTPPGNTSNKYEIGKNNLEKLTGRAENEIKTGYAAFVPVIDTFLKEHLFADIFSRGVLTNQERELTTISALASLGGVESQLQGHLSISMRLGFTEAELRQMLLIIENSIGKKEADAGREVLSKVVALRKQTN